jgi:DNA invertase Pin-like site-specific DNA recombinase
VALRLVGYCRVSSASQRDAGTIEIQERDLAGYAAQHGHELVGVFKDEAVSGATDYTDREGFLELLAALEADPALDGVLIWKLDRLARGLMVQERILADLAARGKKLVSIKDGDDIDSPDPTRVLIRQVLGAMSQYDKSMIAVRLAAGRVNKARKGGYAGGRLALGYGVQDSELVILEGEARVVRIIHHLRKDGLTLRAIAAELEAQGAPTQRGGRWRASTVAGILDNAKYRGTMTYSGQVAQRADLALLEAPCTQKDIFTDKGVPTCA